VILLLGPLSDPMMRSVGAALQARSQTFVRLNSEEVPNTVRFELKLPEREGAFFFPEGAPLELAEVRAVYHRVGFSNFEVYQEYSPDEVAFVNHECQSAFHGWLNCHPGLVINRPVASGSNASKPHQIALVEELGLAIPKTMVTNLPEPARDFYDFVGGQAIYKSISYVRSIVQVMKEDDLDRLDTLKNCPIQIQERIEGVDVRVHVVDEHVFPTRILASESDYRYDKAAELEPCELSDELAQACRKVALALGLVLAGIDLRLTPEGKAYCFEVNPSPAFAWYEDRTGQPIAAAVADLLIQASLSQHRRS